MKDLQWLVGQIMEESNVPPIIKENKSCKFKRTLHKSGYDTTIHNYISGKWMNMYYF